MFGPELGGSRQIGAQFLRKHGLITTRDRLRLLLAPEATQEAAARSGFLDRS